MTDRFTADKLAWLEKVATTPGLPAIAYQLAMILALKFLNRERGYAWPSFVHLARVLGVARSSTIRAVDALQAAGFISVKRGGGRNRANEYRLNIPAKNGVSVDTVSTRDAAVTEQNGISAAQETVAAADINGISPETPFPFKNPLKEPYEAHSRAAAASDGAAARCALDERPPVSVTSPSQPREALERADPSVIALADRAGARSPQKKVPEAPDPAVLDLARETLAQAATDQWQLEVDLKDADRIRRAIQRLPTLTELESRCRILSEGRDAFTDNTQLAAIDSALNVIQSARKNRTVAEFASAA